MTFRHLLIFDKTGTLTLERPVLENPGDVTNLGDDAALELARMTRGSQHPVSRLLLEALGMRGQKLLAEQGHGKPCEVPGYEVFIQIDGTRWSLAKAGWMAEEGTPSDQKNEVGSELRKNGRLLAFFRFRESMSPGSVNMLRSLDRGGLSLHIRSGDHPDKVRGMAEALELPDTRAHGGLSPEE